MQVDVSVRFNQETEEMEVVFNSGENEEVVGVVEREYWSDWVEPYVQERVRSELDSISSDNTNVSDESNSTETTQQTETEETSETTETAESTDSAGTTETE